MEKRAGLIWRIAVVLIVLISLAPIFVINGATADYVPTRPETFMDPLPAYMNWTTISAFPWLSGTSIWSEEGRDVTDIDVQIIRNKDGYRWDDVTGTWVTDPDTWNEIISGGVGALAPDWAYDQWAWNYSGSWTGADLTSGFCYTVKAWAHDNAGFEDQTPAVGTFCFDNKSPNVSMNGFPSVVNSLTEIKGTAIDADGVIDHTRIKINNSSGLYWNGHFWQANPVWIKTQGTNSWSISTTTNPPLPQWKHNTSYNVCVRTVDKANNQATESCGTFLYRKQLTAQTCYLDPLPDYANGATDFILNGFSGTARAGTGHTITDVRVRIVDTSNGSVWWNNTLGGWNTSSVFNTLNWLDCPQATFPWNGTYGQYDWTCPIPGTLAWAQGHIYQITAWTRDNTAPTSINCTTTMDSFTYDTSTPGSWIDAVPVVVTNSWNSLTGGSIDTYGQIGNVVVLIQRSRDNLYWNGAGWGAAEWGDVALEWWDWIFATGSFSSASVTWSVTTTTNPKLPQLRNSESYHIVVRSFDKAGNIETTAIKDFTFRVDMEVGQGYTAPTTVPVATATGGPTATTPGGGGGGGGGAHTAEPTATHQPTPTYTYVPPPHTTAPTATVLPGFSGSATIGPAGGKVTANNNDGSPRVTATFGANALSASADVSITGSGTCIGTPPEGGYYFGNSCFDITPSQALGAMVKICVHYTPADLGTTKDEDNNTDPAKLRLAYKDAEGHWKVLKTTLENGTICAETDHLSSWAVVGKTGAVTEGWEWWYYVAIGIGAVVVVLLLVYLIARPRGKGGEGEEHGEGGYEEGEV